MPPDTAGWREEFKVEYSETRRSPDRVFHLARRILRHQGVVVPNIMCGFIGGSGYEAALTETVAHDLEVVDLRQLDTWSEQRWGVGEKTKLNSSEKFVSLKDFSRDDIEYARSIVQEDMKYYQAVLDATDRHGGASIKGAQIIS